MAFPDKMLAQKYPYKPTKSSATPTIVCHPETQVVYVSNSVTFTAGAENPPVTSIGPGFKYQWQILPAGKKNYLNIPGATNDSFTIYSATTNDVALYRVMVNSQNGTSTSEPACLLVYTTNSPLTVYGSPIVYGGNSACMSGYAGYVNFKKSVAQGWGWVPDHTGGNTNHSATDNNRGDTKVQAGGDVDDVFCAQTTIANTHAGSPAPEDNKYRFTIYFPNHVPTNAYAITLNGFLP